MTWESILKLALPKDYAELAKKYGGLGTFKNNVIIVDFMNDDNARNYIKDIKELLMDQRRVFKILSVGEREGYHRVKIEVG